MIQTVPNIGRVVLEIHAIMYASRLRYIVESTPVIIDGRIRVSLVANDAQWMKVQEEASTWGEASIFPKEILIFTKEDQRVEIQRQGL